MRKCSISLLVAFLFFPVAAPADIEASDYSQSRIAEIFSINHADSTAIMSGYRYSFTGLKGYDLPVIRMQGSNFGSYQMLQVGMRVRVEYRLSKHARVVIQLQEVPRNTRLGVPDVE